MPEMTKKKVARLLWAIAIAVLLWSFLRGDYEGFWQGLTIVAVYIFVSEQEQ